MSARLDAMAFRELASLAEFKRAERFQRAVWGDDDPPDNADLLLAIAHEGGLVAGAFDGDTMLGFLFAFPTAEPRVQHSHRLAVHPRSQGSGIGARLKWYQRDWCLARGIATVRWTYDPLRHANAALNIDRLGATAAIYHEDYYGEMAGINAGIPSDRVVAEWRLGAPEVERRARDAGPPRPAARPAARPSVHPSARPSASSPARDDELQVVIPADLDELLVRDPETALIERLRVRAELRRAFAEGRRIVGFEREGCRYRLSERPGDGTGADPLPRTLR